MHYTIQEKVKLLDESKRIGIPAWKEKYGFTDATRSNWIYSMVENSNTTLECAWTRWGFRPKPRGSRSKPCISKVIATLDKYDYSKRDLEKVMSDVQKKIKVQQEQQQRTIDFLEARLRTLKCEL